MKMLSVRSAEGRGCRSNVVLQTVVCRSLAVIFVPLWIAELFPLDGPQSPDRVRDGLLLRVSICALHQCLRPLKHGCFCGIHVLPQLLRVSSKKCGFKLALPVWVSHHYPPRYKSLLFGVPTLCHYSCLPQTIASPRVCPRFNTHSASGIEAV